MATAAMAIGELGAGTDDSGSSFTFHALETAFPSLQTVPMRDRLVKWNLQPTMVAKAFRFDQAFKPQQLDAFLLDFFNDPEVQEHAPVALPGSGTSGASWGPLGKVTAVKKECLAATLLRLDMFDQLEATGIVRSGNISGCLDAQVGEVLVSDRLRLALLDEAAEEYDAFSTAQRRELLFHVMRRLAVGGGLNQWDDAIEPYLSACKALYKDLVAVQKEASTGKLQVRSLCYEVTEAVGDTGALFPRASPHNFCYVCVDPVQRQVKYWYAAWFPMM